MLKKHYLTFVIAAVTGLGMASQPVCAQEEVSSGAVYQYSPKYKKGPEVSDNPDAPQSLFPNYYYIGHFLRLPDAEDGEMTLRISSPSAVSGCLNMHKPEIKVIDTGQIVWLELTEAQVSVDASPQYGHNACKKSQELAFTDVKLHRDTLLENGTRKLVLKSKSIGQFSDMELDIHDNRVSVTTKAADLSRFGLPLTGGTDMTTYWFYPENTVILQAPDAEFTPETRTQISRLATARGMTPLEDHLPGFRPDEQNSRKMYFVDAPGIIAGKIEGTDDRIPFGSVTTSEPFYGPEGRYDRAIEKPVYAKRPGLYE